MDAPQPEQQSSTPGDNSKRTFVPYATFWPSSEDLKNHLLFCQHARGYEPFNHPSFLELGKLFDRAMGEGPERRQAVEITGDKGTQLRAVQIKLKKKTEEVEKLEQYMAAWRLVDIVTWGVWMIEGLIHRRLEMMRLVAKGMYAWPIVLPFDNNWPEIVQKAQKLKPNLDPKGSLPVPTFHPAHGDESQLPARRWAKLAAFCIYQTKWLQQQLRDMEPGPLLRLPMTIADAPPWAVKARDLPDLSNNPGVLSQWRPVIREMIRQQVRDFHKHPDWKQVRDSSRVRSKKVGAIPTKGEIENAILDDITAALRSIAPRSPKKQSS